MFTDKAQAVIDQAKDQAFSTGAMELGFSALLAAAAVDAEAGVLLAECIGLTPEKLRLACPALPGLKACIGKMPLNSGVRAMLVVAKEMAQEVPDRRHPGLIDVRHMVCALANSREACALLNVTALGREDVIRLLMSWGDRQWQTPRLDELLDRLRRMRSELLAKVFGQDHAVHAFVEGLFSAEVVAAVDDKHRSPRAVFVFAGPPGVGKTYLAESGAAYLDRPFKRFDMSAYSGHQQNEQLVGMAKSFHAAHPGTLTEFVEKNPNAVLLFDEIEKSHLNTIHLFLQILDAGALEDKYHERNVSFRETTIIFTTNAGRKLYDSPNESGVHAANAAFHRKTILDALENERDPRTGEPFFPPAICSRLATGYPVLFNHLGVNELERVAQAELRRVAALLQRQYFKHVEFDELLPMCLVLREGARVDARTLRSQAEAFLKAEFFKFCQLFQTDRLEKVFEKLDRIEIRLENSSTEVELEVRALFESQHRPRILLVADTDLADLYRENISQVDWQTTESADEALQILAENELDIVLLDLWLGRSMETGSVSIQGFDHVPVAARGLDRGQELLRKIRQRLPGVPIFLLSLADTNANDGAQGSIDDELFMACVRGGGARGLIVSQFVDAMVKGWESQRDQLVQALLRACQRLYCEKAAQSMGSERKVLTFDTAPQISADNRLASIRLRNLRLARALAAADAGEVLDDVERPRTRFDDVIGADSAKQELSFFIDFLKNPRRFSALGLKPPKGVLLHGPPGTGKTMLARAMAGESNVAFISVSATSFVTIWQGSGPQSVRDLFARARRYAPAIIFVDEIDAIGRIRSGMPGGGHGEEMALNALLTEMDGFTSPSADRPVFVLAATNFRANAEEEGSPERSARTLDPALVRRFSRTILVDLPDTAARRKYLVIRLAGAKDARISASALELMAEKSTGMSIADLEQVIEAAAREALRKGAQISDDLLMEALDTVHEGEAKVWSPQFLESTARHEAGHAIMYWLSGWWPPEVSIVARAGHGGGMRRCEAEIRQGCLSREELLARLRTLLGGRAAEILYYGPARGLTTGASSDLEQATRLARDMICRFGMEQEFGLLATPELVECAEAIGSPMYQRVSEAAGKILRTEMDSTLKALQENRRYLDTVSETLLARNRLLRKDLEQILPRLSRTSSRQSSPATRSVGGVDG